MAAAQGRATRSVASMDLASATLCAKLLSELRGESPIVVSQVVEHIANHPDCLKELGTKFPTETRCVQMWYKIAIQTLLGAGERDLATAVWQRATSLRPFAQAGDQTTTQGIIWPSVLQTPTLWVPGLRSAKTWDCSVFPIVQSLEAQSNLIHQEVMSATALFSAAYPYLTQAGTWQTMFPFRDGNWNFELCRVMPTTCKLLRRAPGFPSMPAVPYITANHEEVVIFRSAPGTSVGLHSGATNAQVNIHLTLAGGKSTSMQIADDRHQLHDGRALCFQDSFAHSVEHLGDQERISLVVRLMHPEMSRETYGGATRTDAVDLAAWDEAHAAQGMQAVQDEQVSATCPSDKGMSSKGSASGGFPGCLKK